MGYHESGMFSSYLLYIFPIWALCLDKDMSLYSIKLKSGHKVHFICCFPYSLISHFLKKKIKRKKITRIFRCCLLFNLLWKEQSL